MVTAAQTLCATTFRETSLARVILGTLETGCHALVKEIRCCREVIVKNNLLIKNNSIELNNTDL
jgi:hypothetical protein